MSEHTKGPWVWVKGNNKYHQELQVHHKASHAYGDSILYHGSDWPIDKANARLIAAAPELLFACKESIEWLKQLEGILDDDGFLNALLSLLRGAIAKAEGK